MRLPKPALGSAAKAKRSRRSAIERAERAAKANAIIRDYGFCRRCRASWPAHVEAAHLVDKGMGGDHGRRSSDPRYYVTLCHSCHQGPRSVHSGHVRMVFNETLMGDGPVEFYDQTPGDSSWAV